MDELIAKIVAGVGIDEDVARKAVGIIFNFLQNDGPADLIDQFMDKVPGARELVAGQSGGGAGGLSGMLGGIGGMGAMGAFNELTSAGLNMDQIKGVTQEVIGFAKAEAGDDLVNQIVDSIPGLGQCV